MTDNAQALTEFMESVWNRGDLDAVDRFLADEYTIHSDPGDPWDGKVLTRSAFQDRLLTSRAPFPDLHFDLIEVIAEGDRVAIAWNMRGTQTGPLGQLASTGRRIDVQGMTVYYFWNGRITGHRQIVDRLSVVRQLGIARINAESPAAREPHARRPGNER
jgi:steroid delta-isomerase-like uncharacterized protein